MAFTATPRHNSGSIPNPSFRKLLPRIIAVAIIAFLLFLSEWAFVKIPQSQSVLSLVLTRRVIPFLVLKEFDKNPVSSNPYLSIFVIFVFNSFQAF